MVLSIVMLVLLILILPLMAWSSAREYHRTERHHHEASE